MEGLAFLALLAFVCRCAAITGASTGKPGGRYTAM
jgi:hypothetical protein